MRAGFRNAKPVHRLKAIRIPDKLVVVWNREKDGSFSNTSYATFQDWKAGVHSFRYIAARSYW